MVTKFHNMEEYINILSDAGILLENGCSDDTVKKIVRYISFDCPAPVAWAVRKCPERNGLRKGVCLCTHCVRTSTISHNHVPVEIVIFSVH